MYYLQEKFIQFEIFIHLLDVFRNKGKLSNSYGQNISNLQFTSCQTWPDYLCRAPVYLPYNPGVDSKLGQGVLGDSYLVRSLEILTIELKDSPNDPMKYVAYTHAVFTAIFLLNYLHI